jgi:hypothetical protein
MITRKDSDVYRAGLICKPNLDVLLNRQKIEGNIFYDDSTENRTYFPRGYVAWGVIEPIRKKFEW